MSEAILNELLTIINGASTNSYFINESKFPNNIKGNNLKIAKATLTQLGYAVSSEYLYSKAANGLSYSKTFVGEINWAAERPEKGHLSTKPYIYYLDDTTITNSISNLFIDNKSVNRELNNINKEFPFNIAPNNFSTSEYFCFFTDSAIPETTQLTYKKRFIQDEIITTYNYTFTPVNSSNEVTLPCESLNALVIPASYSPNEKEITNGLSGYLSALTEWNSNTISNLTKNLSSENISIPDNLTFTKLTNLNISTVIDTQEKERETLQTQITEINNKFQLAFPKLTSIDLEINASLDLLQGGGKIFDFSGNEYIFSKDNIIDNKIRLSIDKYISIKQIILNKKLTIDRKNVTLKEINANKFFGKYASDMRKNKKN